MASMASCFPQLAAERRARTAGDTLAVQNVVPSAVGDSWLAHLRLLLQYADDCVSTTRPRGTPRVLAAEPNRNTLTSPFHAAMNGIQSGGTSHEQVRQKAVTGDSPTCAQYMGKAGIPLLAAAILAAAGCNPKHPQAAETAPAVVLVSRPIERKNVSDYQVFTARTQAVQSVDIKARVSGFLTKIPVKDGAEVKEGDILFQIDDRPHKAALDQAKATLAKAKASLDLGRAAEQICDVFSKSTCHSSMGPQPQTLRHELTSVFRTDAR
jgi:hypothetical protein